MDGAKAQQAPHNVAVLVLPECGAIPGNRNGVRLEQPVTYAGGVARRRVLACPEFQEG